MNGIWIRSQDRKGLFYAKRIVIERFREVQSNEYRYRIINQVLYQDDADDYNLLGVYSTEERAIDILDDMHWFIEESINKPHKVFKMPKE